MKQKLKDCWTLFYLCLIMGATCFGGGYGMIPVMEREFVTKRKYVGESDMADIVSLAQSLPGLISFNTVILISYRKAGFLGVLASVFGLLIPSLVIISVIVVLYELIADNKWVEAALKGIKCAVIGVLIYAVYKLAKNSLEKWYHYLIAIAVLLVSLFVDINPIYIILIVGVTFTLACYINDIFKKKRLKKENAVFQEEIKEEQESQVVGEMPISNRQEEENSSSTLSAVAQENCISLSEFMEKYDTEKSTNLEDSASFGTLQETKEQDSNIDSTQLEDSTFSAESKEEKE